MKNLIINDTKGNRLRIQDNKLSILYKEGKKERKIGFVDPDNSILYALRSRDKQRNSKINGYTFPYLILKRFSNIKGVVIMEKETDEEVGFYIDSKDALQKGFLIAETHGGGFAEQLIIPLSVCQAIDLSK